MEIGKVKSQTASDREYGEHYIEVDESIDNTNTRQPNAVQRLFNVKNRKYRTCLKIIKGIITNPIIFMTVLGAVCGKYVFRGEGDQIFNQTVDLQTNQ